MKKTDITNTNLTDIENRLWSAADELRANSRLEELAVLNAEAHQLEERIHFRFPGHENVSMVESPLGLIPQR